MRRKSQAVLMYSQGLDSSNISVVVSRSSYSVSSWIRHFSKTRMASIFSGHSDNNNAGKLTKDQQLEIKTILANPPSVSGIPKEMWDVPTLKNYIMAKFEIVYESDESYYFLLRFSGLSFKYPDVFDLRRDETLIQGRMAAIRSEITPMLIDDDWDVFSCDEVKMQQEAIIRRCWLKKGERTVIKVNRQRESQSYIGFLSQKSYKVNLYEMDWQNSDEVLIALEKFLADNPTKRLCIIWDNAPFHRSIKIREALGKGNLLEKIHLIAMPPYAPDENPIEHVWNTAKQKVSNIQRDNFQTTKQAFSDFITSRSFKYSF